MVLFLRGTSIFGKDYLIPGFKLKERYVAPIEIQ